MLDFFDYSGVFVQSHLRLVELTNPRILGYKLMREDEQRKEYNKIIPKPARTCNLFQIAKVGTPNMIFPSTLDIQMKNFQDEHQYLQIADHFFPEASRQQFTVVVIKPMIVKNGLNDLFVEILKANDFLILQRVRKTVNKREAAVLCKLEDCTKENIELYVSTLLAGPSEIVIASKVGAVQDAFTIVSGSKTGRKRAN